MKLTMMHQQPCKIASAEAHNTRKHKLDYIFPELTQNNQSYYFDTRKLNEVYKECKEVYQNQVGQKMQEKTAPIREAVVLIDENTTLDDVKMLAEEIGEYLQWKPLQVHIHRDEGHKKSGDNKGGPEVAKLNLHAHIIFDTQNKLSGKMNNAKKEKLSVCQDICARVLRMERGQSSTKKHLDALTYKIKAQEKNLQELKNQIDILNARNNALEQQNLTLKKFREQKQAEIEKVQKNLLETQKSRDTALEHAEKYREALKGFKDAFNYYAYDQGELEYMATRFVEAYRKNPAYTGYTNIDDMFDDFAKMVNQELRQNRGMKI